MELIGTLSYLETQHFIFIVKLFCSWKHGKFFWVVFCDFRCTWAGFNHCIWPLGKSKPIIKTYDDSSNIFYYNPKFQFYNSVFFKSWLSCDSQGNIHLCLFWLQQENVENSVFCKDIVMCRTLGSEDKSG